VSDEIVGRGNELAAVERFVDRAARQLAALVIEGDAGIGKTTLWHAAIGAARTSGFAVLTCRPARSEQQLTLGGLTDLLVDVDGAVLAALPVPQRHALEIALLRVAPSGMPPDQRTLSVAVAGLLRYLAESAPLLIAIDDAHWLDEGSAAILRYAIRRLADRPVGVLAASRMEARGPAPLDIRDAVHLDSTERIRLGPMPLASLHRLLEVRLGRSFPRLVLLRIERASGGNPLYALEIARNLSELDIPVMAPDPLPVPDSLSLLMNGRIAEMPEATARALLLAAAAAEPTVGTIERARPGSVAALDPAIERGIVQIEAGTVRFTHPLLAQAVLTLGPADRLRSAHEALAGATSSPDARARHLGQAATGPDESVAVALARAAAIARERGATLDAAALYLDAHRATPDEMGGPRLDRARLAAECLFVDLSEMVQADEILGAALGGAPSGPARAEALSVRALVLYYHGRVPDAVTMAEEAIEEAGVDGLLRARILGRLAFLVMQLDLERGLGLVSKAVAILERSEAPVDPDLLANALLLRAAAQLGLVRPTRRSDIERGLRLISANGRSWEREGADGSAFGIARMTDDLDRAIEMTRELIRSKSGPAGDDPFNLVQLSGLLVHRGAWREARVMAEAAMDAYEREGLHPAWGLRGLALVAAHDGRLDVARGAAEEGLRIATDRGDTVIAAFHRQVLGFVALSVGDWAAADGHLSAAADLAARMSIRHPGRFKVAGDLVETAIALGDVERAAAVQAGLDEAARIAPTPWVVAVGARSSALILAARGDLDGAMAELERALIEHRALQMPFEEARTLLVKGRLHRRRREKRRADETLRAALEQFEALVASIWAEQARLELGRVGLRPRAPAELTATERRVAELAAQGLSGRQIADRAFLAPKTVGNVLGRVYEKLGIRSRAELGATMAAQSIAGRVTAPPTDAAAGHGTAGRGATSGHPRRD
jgi:DNA-binding CsgD family transcriptional regulator